jgi:hypothetical protein
MPRQTSIIVGLTVMFALAYRIVQSSCPQAVPNGDFLCLRVCTLAFGFSVAIVWNAWMYLLVVDSLRKLPYPKVVISPSLTPLEQHLNYATGRPSIHQILPRTAQISPIHSILGLN